jgi:N6-adenosine-specific RNA methylase IME4
MSSKFNIIYADPAWSYNDKCNAGKRGACHKYTVTSTADLRAIPVANIAADDCALFMWATCPMLPDAFSVMGAWGFSYKTVAFVWVKTNKIKPTPFWGMGHWTRANAELCLLGVKGNPKRVSKGVHQIIQRKIMRHSQKPPEARDLIVKLMGDLPRVELFARDVADGWQRWGNEIESTIEL